MKVKYLLLTLISISVLCNDSDVDYEPTNSATKSYAIKKSGELSLAMIVNAENIQKAHEFAKAKNPITRKPNYGHELTNFPTKVLTRSENRKVSLKCQKNNKTYSGVRNISDHMRGCSNCLKKVDCEFCKSSILKNNLRAFAPHVSKQYSKIEEILKRKFERESINNEAINFIEKIKSIDPDLSLSDISNDNDESNRDESAAIDLLALNINREFENKSLSDANINDDDSINLYSYLLVDESNKYGSTSGSLLDLNANRGFEDELILPVLSTESSEKSECEKTGYKHEKRKHHHHNRHHHKNDHHHHRHKRHYYRSES